MHSTSIMANLRVAGVETAKSFYSDFLGLGTEFNLRWVARYASPRTPAAVQLVTDDPNAPEDSAISVNTDAIDGAYAGARQLGCEIFHPLTP